MPTFTGQIGTGLGDVDFSQELAGSTLAGSWQQYFDPYDWQKEIAYGKQYQGALGGLFEKAGTGTMDLMSSWAGGGQTLSGRKLGQRKTLGKGTAYDAFKLGQGLDIDRYTARTAWEREQRSNLNTLLGMDIWDTGSGLGTVTPSYAEGESQFEAQDPYYQSGFPDEESYNQWIEETGGDWSQIGAYGGSGLAAAENLSETLGLSGVRLKKDINHLFTLDNGVPIYTFKYKWSDDLQIGTMAQDIEGFMPDAVGEINGIKYVNYSLIWG